jgi:hypothetical protein
MTLLSGLLRQQADGLEARGLRTLHSAHSVGSMLRSRVAVARDREGLPPIAADKLVRLCHALETATDVPPDEVVAEVAASLRTIADAIDGLAAEGVGGAVVALRDPPPVVA